VKLRRYFLPALAGLFLLALAAAAPAQVGTPIPAPPQRWLTDSAGLLSPAAAAEIDSRLEAYERATGRQVIVYIGSTTGNVPIEDWAVKAFASWKVGRRGLDDGLALFIMAADKRLRIEVGYGLEGVVPDALAGRVINDDIVPRLQAGDNDGAVRAGVERLLAIVSGDEAAAGGAEPGDESRPMSLSEKILLGIGILFFLILFITNPSLAIYLLFSILSGGRGGGRGGFSGGGGRSGGGGASGSW
jgi:uncharacterized protein